jgi:hypothetical protein
MYAATISENKKEARRRLRMAEASYASLKNKDSLYAREHVALIEIYKKVCAVYDASPSEIEIMNGAISHDPTHTP